MGGGRVPVYEAKVPYDPEARRPWRWMPFPQGEYERRIAAVQARLKTDGLAALVAYSNGADRGNARYLVNFETNAGDTIVVVPADRGQPAAARFVAHRAAATAATAPAKTGPDLTPGDLSFF